MKKSLLALAVAMPVLLAAVNAFAVLGITQPYK
jgi:hypothetical protein